MRSDSGDVRQTGPENINPQYTTFSTLSPSLLTGSSNVVAHSGGNSDRNIVSKPLSSTPRGIYSLNQECGSGVVRARRLSDRGALQSGNTNSDIRQTSQIAQALIPGRDSQISVSNKAGGVGIFHYIM
jgi:hypothetical protein